MTELYFLSTCSIPSVIDVCQSSERLSSGPVHGYSGIVKALKRTCSCWSEASVDFALDLVVEYYLHRDCVAGLSFPSPSIATNRVCKTSNGTSHLWEAFLHLWIDLLCLGN